MRWSLLVLNPTKINSALLRLRSAVKAFRNSSVSLLRRCSLEAAALSLKADTKHKTTRRYPDELFRTKTQPLMDG